jgi:predicted nucleic acid-binding protein
VPEQVLVEYQVGAQPLDPDLTTFPWVQIRRVSIDPAVLDELDLGGAAAIALAEVQPVRAVLMDDRAGRRVARGRGLTVVGTLTVLLRAKAAGLIPAVGPIMDRMIAQGRYISPTVCAQVLAAADET